MIAHWTVSRLERLGPKLYVGYGLLLTLVDFLKALLLLSFSRFLQHYAVLLLVVVEVLSASEM